MTYQLLDLFAGIGGFSLGLERTGGFQTVAFCEANPYAQRILEKNWPGVKCYEDIRDLTADRLKRDGFSIDAMCGGPPCQDISLAGKGLGIYGSRSILWFEFARLIGEIRPRVVFIENVSALLGRGLDSVLRSLAKIGYDAEWNCIPATAVNAPHQRDRIWIVAYPQRDKQRWKEPRLRAIRRMGREFKPVSWDRTWQDTLAALRGMDDGFSRSVDRTDRLRNAIVPQVPQLIGQAWLEQQRY